jgi:sugar-specific transcriptional regulator TrmB
MDTKILEAVGFTKGEIKVYLALLELGETTTGPIIEKSGITGSKVYEILDKLIDKGLVSYIIREKTKHFQTASPKRLMDYINKKENELTQQKNQIEKIIPSLESIQKSKQKIQSSQIFEGYRGIRTVLNLILETLKQGEEYYAFALGDQVKDKNVLTFILNHHQRRIKKGIKVKLIAGSRKKEFAKVSKLKGLQLRYYDNPVPLGVFIFKDYVATLTFKEKPTAFLIKSEQIANSYRDFFVSLWEKSKI